MQCRFTSVRTIRHASTIIALTLGAMLIGSTTASAAGPSCPEGSTYNKQTKMCERSPTVVCPSGSSYDPATGLCTKAATPGRTCAEGLTYNPETRTCEGRKVCPEGYFEISFADDCFPESGTGDPVPPECPSGSTDPDGDDVCTAAPTGATCDAGMSYDASRDQCIAVAQYACPQGYGISPATGNCQTLPIKGRKT